MQSQTTPQMLQQSRLSYAAGFITAVVGLLVLVGWQFDVAILKSFVSGTVTMKANTAAAFLLAGLALVFLQRSGRAANILVRFCGSVIVLIGLMSLAQHLFGWDIGFDEILFHEPEGTIGTSHPGLMAPNTALNFLLLGFAFFLLTLQRFRTSLLLEFSIVFSLIISILGLVGYFAGLVELTGPSAYTQMAVNTACMFLILCVGMLLTVYEQQRAPITIVQKLFAGLTTAAAVIIFISFLSVSGITSILQARDYVENTQEVKNQIGAVLTHVLEVQLGDRGFILTGDNNYLVEHSKALDELSTLLDNIRSQTADNPRQRKTLVALEKLVGERMVFSKRRISTRRTEGEAKARLLFPIGSGKALIDSISVLVAQMLAEEDRLLRTRDEDQTQQANRNQLITHLSLAVQVLLLAFIFLVVKRDVTGRQKAEEALRQSEEKFRNVFENSPIGKSLTTIDGQVQVNREFADMLGYSVEELSTLHWKQVTHPDDIEESQNVVASLLSGNSNTARYQKRYLHRNGSIVWADVSTFIQKDEHGKPQFFITSISDITDRKHVEENIRQANAKLEAANKELEAFSYSVSHDLRAPLRHVGGFVGLLEKHAAVTLDEKGRRYLTTIADSTKEMGALIDDLLSFSRMGRAEMHTMSVNLTALVKEAVDKLSIETKGRTVEWRIEPLAEVLGDPSMLRQAFVNLISNALKYTRTREKAIIEIGVQENVHETVFFVRDNGVGFDMQYKDKLFGVFQRLHSSKDFEGTGIGLANVRRIITRHGGKTWAESEPNNGATFYFSLPTNQKGSL